MVKFMSDIKPQDMTVIRDYTLVSDIATGHLCALNYIENGHNITCNLGTGEGHSIKEIINLIEKYSKKK